MTVKTIKTNTSYSAGKRFVEFHVNTTSGSGPFYVGVDGGSSVFVSPRALGIGESPYYFNSVSYKSNGRIFSQTSVYDNTSTGGLTAQPLVEGDVIGMEVDLDTGAMAFYHNGVLQASFAYPAGQNTKVAVSLAGIGQSISANLDDNLELYNGMPEGFTFWSGAFFIDGNVEDVSAGDAWDYFVAKNQQDPTLFTSPALDTVCIDGGIHEVWVGNRGMMQLYNDYGLFNLGVGSVTVRGGERCIYFDDENTSSFHGSFLTAPSTTHTLSQPSVVGFRFYVGNNPTGGAYWRVTLASLRNYFTIRADGPAGSETDTVGVFTGSGVGSETVVPVTPFIRNSWNWVVCEYSRTGYRFILNGEEYTGTLSYSGSSISQTLYTMTSQNGADTVGIEGVMYLSKVFVGLGASQPQGLDVLALHMAAPGETV